MKVTVAKTPGSRAVAVEIAEGGTVLDALKAADMDSSLGDGFEVRVGFEPATLSDVVTNNAIITLTAKITGNAARVVHIAGDADRVAPGTFVLEKVTNSKSIFQDVEVQAYILSATNAVGDLVLDSWNAAIFGENADGSLTAVKDRPLNNGTFLTTAPTLYCVVHGPLWDDEEKDANFLLDKYFKLTQEAQEETCEESADSSEEGHCCTECACDDCSCGNDKTPCIPKDVPSTIRVNLCPTGDGELNLSRLQELMGLIEKIDELGKEIMFETDLDINIHIRNRR